MRKLKVQMNISLDNKWDKGMSDFSIENLKDVDNLLHGRKTGEGFIPYWNAVANNSSDAEHALGRRFSEIPSIIFSNTMTASTLSNTTIMGGDLAEGIRKLKSGQGGNIMVYGGDSFVSSLLQYDLVDQLYLLINPTAIGSASSAFNPLKNDPKVRLIKCKPFDCGTVALCYTREKNRPQGDSPGDRS